MHVVVPHFVGVYVVVPGLAKEPLGVLVVVPEHLGVYVLVPELESMSLYQSF